MGHDRSPVKENMMNTATESEKNASAPGVLQPKARRATAKKAKAAKKAGRAGKPASKPKTDRANKKAEAIALMKRSKGVTLAKIIAAVNWHAHALRGFLSDHVLAVFERRSVLGLYSVSLQVWK